MEKDAGRQMGKKDEELDDRREMGGSDAFGGAETYEALEALGSLCSALGRLFSYPTYEEAAAYTDAESTRFLLSLASSAQIDDKVLRACAPCSFKTCKVESSDMAKGSTDIDAARNLRIECTQLFFMPQAPVPLEGRRWVKHAPYSSERKIGEEASVMRCYRESGLKLQRGVVARADSLSTELDFVAYLIRRETCFSNEGKGAQALVWKRRRTAFATTHLVPLAQAVSEGVARLAVSPHLQYWAQLVRRVALRCSL